MEKRSPKAHCPHLLPRNGIDTREASVQRVWRRCRAPKRQEERRESEGPVVSRSSQVNVLQLEQQSIGE